MTSRRLLAAFIVTAALGSSSASAGPITSYVPSSEAQNDAPQQAQSQQNPNDPGSSFTALFDPIGVPMLRVLGPLYLQLGERNKLRFGGGSGVGDAGTYSVGGPPIGNLNPQLPIVGGADPHPAVGPVAAIPEPATVLLLAPAVALALRRRARARK
jgi:hypothetical protein